MALAIAHGAAGQETLSIDTAVRDTLAHNASLLAARAAAEQADHSVDEARAGWFPRVSVAESWQRGDEPVFVFSSLLSARRFTASNFAIDVLNHPDPTGFFRTTLGIDQLIFDGGRRRAAIDAASARRDMTSLVADAAAAQLAVAATQAYGRVLAADAARRAAEAAVAAAREDHARAERRRDAGMANDADVLALAVFAADVQQRAIQANGDAAVARAELNRLMGAPIDRDYTIAEPAETVPAAQSDTATLLAEAARVRPELRRAEAASRLADVGRSDARGALMPQVAAQAAFDVSGTSIGDRASAWIVGGELRWTLSLGGAERARLRSAASEQRRARAELADARAAIEVEVVTALRRLEAARARQAVGRAAVEEALESQRIIRDRADAGLASVNDVLRAATAVLDAETRRISALVDAVVAGAELRRAVGRTP